MTYFVMAGPFVKIGFTRNLVKRVAALQAHCPYRVVDVRVTDKITEKEAHRKAILIARSQGEWFQINRALMEWIDSIPHIRPAYEKRTNGRLKILSQPSIEKLMEAAVPAEGGVA